MTAMRNLPPVMSEQPMEYPDEESGQQESTPQTRLAARFTQFSGPLPPAAELARYDQIMPGLAERIVGMAEHEQKYALNEDRFQRRMHWLFKLGAYGAVLSVVFYILYMSFVLFEAGNLTGGIAGIIGGVVTVLVAIIKGANQK